MWNSVNSTEWPGEEMKDNGDDWKVGVITYELPVNVILNAGDLKSQTLVVSEVYI